MLVDIEPSKPDPSETSHLGRFDGDVSSDDDSFDCTFAPAEAMHDHTPSSDQEARKLVYEAEDTRSTATDEGGLFDCDEGGLFDCDGLSDSGTFDFGGNAGDDGGVDAMEKAVGFVKRALLGHWHVRVGSVLRRFDTLVDGTQVIHVLDEVDWVNEAYEGPEESDIYSLWLLRVKLKHGILPELADLSKLVKERLHAELGPTLDCLLPSISDSGDNMLRIRLLVGKQSGTMSVLDHVLRKLAVNQLSLSLPSDVIIRIQAAIAESPTIAFRAPGVLSEQALASVLARAGPVVRLAFALEEVPSAGGTLSLASGTCEFKCVSDAATAFRVLDGKIIEGGIWHIRRSL